MSSGKRALPTGVSVVLVAPDGRFRALAFRDGDRVAVLRSQADTRKRLGGLLSPGGWAAVEALKAAGWTVAPGG